MNPRPRRVTLTGLAPHLLPTLVIGSYPQPDWLIDRAALGSRLPPRTRAAELWRVDGEFLPQAQDDATRLAVDDLQQCGIDIVTDGEQRRESYSNRFATALDGVDVDNPGTATDRSGAPNPVPRVVGPVRRRRAVNVRDLGFVKGYAERPVSVTVPGPFTMTQQAQDDHYGDKRALALDYAAAVNEELRELQDAGADMVQIDEPYLQPRLEDARRYAIEVINRALQGITIPKTLHTCFGYARVIHDKPNAYPFLGPLDECDADLIAIEAAQPRLDLSRLRELNKKLVAVGVLDLGDHAVETAETVALRLRAALEHVSADRLVAAPDCGMKYLPRAVAQGKLRALVAGAAMVRSELT